jgi:outer membrane protein assembly factor BamE
MRLVLIPALCLSLLAGCSNIEIGHRIDVQQGNALDPENVARLKPGLSRSQVRFLLGTPLLVDPFRTDRWDYVYLFYQAGTLVERKRVSLFFEGDTLVRIEGDVPAEVLATPPNAAPAVTVPASPLPEPAAPTEGVPAPPAGDGSLSIPPEVRP